MQFVDGLSEQQLRIYNDLKHLILELNPAPYEKPSMVSPSSTEANGSFIWLRRPSQNGCIWAFVVA